MLTMGLGAGFVSAWSGDPGAVTRYAVRLSAPAVVPANEGTDIEFSGKVKSLGADCIEKEMRPEHYALLEDLLRRGEADHKAKPEQFRRYGSARKLYNFNIDNAAAY